MKKYIFALLINCVFVSASFASILNAVPSCPNAFPAFPLTQVKGPLELNYFAVSSASNKKLMVTVFVHANGAADALASANKIVTSGLVPVWNQAHLYDQHGSIDSYYCAYTSNVYVLSDQSPLQQYSSPFAAADYLITSNNK